jgi:hypothetical protein
MNQERQHTCARRTRKACNTGTHTTQTHTASVAGSITARTTATPHVPAGHSSHDVCPARPLYVPASHARRVPFTHASPGAHWAAPLRIVAPTVSGVEYLAHAETHMHTHTEFISRNAFQDKLSDVCTASSSDDVVHGAGRQTRCGVRGMSAQHPPWSQRATHQPIAIPRASLEPAGQYTTALPHSATVSFTDPGPHT